MPATIDLDTLGLDRGGHLLVQRALAEVPIGQALEVRGNDPALGVHLRAWARSQGHAFEVGSAGAAGVLRRGSSAWGSWPGAERAGGYDPGQVVTRPGATWGVAARGALVEPGGPAVHFDIEDRDLVWAEIAPRLYAQAAASQWDPRSAVDWDAEFDLPPEIEAAVVQVMTYLVENEQVALIVPARFLGRIHPHFREVLQVLAVQAADEARHMEVFARRAALRGGPLGVSGSGGRASLASLLHEHDFALASFLLSVLGEGSFLNLLGFLEIHAPDPVSRRITHLARQDESRHVAFGMAHLEHQIAVDPHLRARLRAAIERRHDALLETVGLNQQVFDALVLLAAGEWQAAAIARGYAAVEGLQAAMDEGRQRRLSRLGFPPDEAAALSALHTRNFM
ncbi:MAG TPA: ferritin-like domain-containing protein [Chloroflexota bacterium]